MVLDVSVGKVHQDIPPMWEFSVKTRANFLALETAWGHRPFSFVFFLIVLSPPKYHIFSFPF